MLGVFFLFLFFIWWQRIWTPRRVFLTMTPWQYLCGAAWWQKTTETVTHRRSFSLRWITKIISSSVVMEQINQSEMWPVSHIYRRSVAHCMRCLSLRHQLRSSASCLLSDCLKNILSIVPMGCCIKDHKTGKTSNSHHCYTLILIVRKFKSLYWFVTAWFLFLFLKKKISKDFQASFNKHQGHTTADS